MKIFYISINTSSGFANNKGAVSQSARIYLLESMKSKLASCKISIFILVSVAEETSLSLALSETPKNGFVIIIYMYNCFGKGLAHLI